MILTRSEEMLLIAVHRLQHDAYGVNIRNLMKEFTGKEMAFGALFVQLDRLAKKELLSSYLTEPTPERGGRSKRIYLLTGDGKNALIRTKKVQETIWQNIDGLGLDKT